MRDNFDADEISKSPATREAWSRRDFLETGLAATSGLIVAFIMPPMAQKVFAQQPKTPLPTAPNAFIHIAPDNSVTMIINKLEMGQGVNTSLAQLIAEELECDWTKIKSISASVNPVYNHTYFGMQMTGGSSSLNSSWDQHRKLGASMREMLKAAAAKRWKVNLSEVSAAEGYVTHAKHGKLSYGELANEANHMPFPKDVKLKDPKDFKVIGKSMPRLDAPDKTNGKAIFGIDVRIPGLMFASIARPPVPSATVVSVDTSAAEKVPGVKKVIKLDDRVGVFATNTYAAKKGRDALQIKWDLKGNDQFSDDTLFGELRTASAKPGLLAKASGDSVKGLAAAKKVFEADYEFPFLAHAPMEPLNCTIDYNGKKATLWAGFQMPTMDRTVAAKTLGLAPEKVDMQTTYAGGSFGRRACKTSDYVLEACQFAKVLKKPFKITNSREDDFAAQFYRPMNFHRVRWGLDEKKEIAGWHHHVIGHTVMGGSVFGAMMIKDGLEATVTEGTSDTPYAINNFRCEQTRVTTPITTLWWRSVGHTHNAFVMETMMDEVAEAAGKDPIEMRKNMLAASPRHLQVLEELVRLSGWGNRKAPHGRAWGVAIHESFKSVVGNVVEVSYEKGETRVHKVWSAVHCGSVVNPEGAKSQVESSVAFGISAALYQKIRIDKGRIVTANFLNDDYRVLRIQEMPEVQVAFVSTQDTPTGLGEPGLPPVAPAIANALYRLTSKRVRRLPIGNEKLV